MINIGLDLDNTIINYSETFYEVALEKKLIPRNFSKNKVLIKDFFHKNKKYDLFTKLQGEIYGKQIIKAKIYSGFKEFIDLISNKEANLYIISHKTKYPIIGDKVDLHECAINFLKKKNILDNTIIKQKNIFFEPTVEKKIKRIINLKLDVFVDDLPKILLHQDFPSATKKILIDYSNSNKEFTGITANKWNEVFKNIFDFN
jgi:hypothetical protein